MIVGVVGCGEIGSVAAIERKEKDSAVDCAPSQQAIVSATGTSGGAESALASGSGWVSSDKAGSANGAAVNCGIGWPWPTDSSGATGSFSTNAMSAAVDSRLSFPFSRSVTAQVVSGMTIGVSIPVATTSGSIP